MTIPDPTRRHVVTAPHKYGEGRWWGACTCGEDFLGLTAESIREQGRPHRDAQQQRLSEVERKAADVG